VGASLLWLVGNVLALPTKVFLVAVSESLGQTHAQCSFFLLPVHNAAKPAKCPFALMAKSLFFVVTALVAKKNRDVILHQLLVVLQRTLQNLQMPTSTTSSAKLKE